MIKKFTFLIALLAIAQFVGAQTVIWGDQPGEGDFDGGFNGWTTEAAVPGTDSAWVWSPDGDIGAAAYVSGVIGSATASNGAAVFNYNLNVGQPAPPFPYTDMTSHLISPAIDISGAPSPYLALEFHQLARKLNSAPGEPLMGIRFSQDGGVTWMGNPQLGDATIDANPTLAVNAPSMNELSRVNIPGQNLDLSLPLWIRFTYAGDFYAWALDDVKVVTREPYDLSITNNPFFSIAPNYSTPEGMMSQHGFLVDIYNLGGFSMDNTVATISIEDASGTEVFTDNLPYGTLTPDTLAENQNFNSFFPTNLSQGVYTGTYSVAGDSTESDVTNNTASFTFEISDTTFAKENGANDDISPARDLFPGLWSWAYGTVYYVDQANGKFARSISFGINQDAQNNPESVIAGEFLLLKLYKWDDANLDRVAQPDERTELGFGAYEVQAADNLNTVSTVLLRQPDNTLADIPLEDDMHYICVMEYNSADMLTTMHPAVSDEFDYAAREFQDAQVDSTKMSHAQVLGLGEDLTTTDYSTTFVFGQPNEPVVRLGIGDVGVSVKDLPTLADNTMTISPNPAVDQVYLSIALEEMAKNTVIEVMNAMGQTIRVYDLNNVQIENKQVPVSDLGVGTYFVRLTTENGTITKPFQVIR